MKTRAAEPDLSRHVPRHFWLAVAAVAAGALVLNGSSLLLDFISDDYTLLDRVITRGAAAIFDRSHPLWGYWRPWSRELHFWILHWVAGTNAVAFHAASLALWLAVLAAFAALVRRTSGDLAALVATAGAACLTGFATTLGWAAGAQELWALLFSLLFLLAFGSRRSFAAEAALAGALLSKELALVLPALAFAWSAIIDRETRAVSLRRVWPYALLVVLWLAIHPTLLHHGPAQPAESLERVPIAIGLGRGVLAWLNLHALPAPEHGWLGPAVLGLAAGSCFAVGLRLLGAWRRVAKPEGKARRGRSEPARSNPGSRGTESNVLLFALVWAVFGLFPYALPFIGWQAYYGLFGGLGAWLLLGTILSRRATAAVLVLASLAVLQLAQVDTPAWAWGGPAFQRRNAHLLARLRADLRAARPQVGANTRLYFSEVPRGIGVGHDWFNPAFRVWYRDTTVTGAFLSTYRPRSPGAPEGSDLFFHYAEDDKWHEVRVGPEDLARSRLDAGWADSHELLALTFGQSDDWERAAGEIEKLAQVYPNREEYPVNLAECYDRMGKHEQAALWRARADSLTHRLR